MRNTTGRWRAAGGAALGLALVSAAPARGYEYRALGWDPELWPPGETLTITLVDSDVWLDSTDHVDAVSSIEDVREVLQRALDVWAAVPTADVRWEVGEIIPQAAWDAIPANERPLMAVLPVPRDSPVRFTGAKQGFVMRDGVERMRYCYVFLNTRNRESLFSHAVHEFGHCLGSAHPEPYTVGDGWLERDAYPVPWQTDPVMSYGRNSYGFETRLTADDEIFASLARPAAGWLETTGTILARVTLPGGEEVPWAYVLATRFLEPRGASYSVGRSTSRGRLFKDEAELPPKGVADLRGLPPGDYWLLVRSPTGVGNPRVVIEPLYGAVLDLRQTLRAGPVRVRAGEEVRVTLPVRRVGRLP